MERETSSLPANLMRTMPYTSYVAVSSYAVIFMSVEAALLMGGLILNEVLNAGTKWLLRRVSGKDASLLRRPEGAVDSGIYPQHYPRPSTTSGMPSGHSQTAGFLAVVLTSIVQERYSTDAGELGDSADDMVLGRQSALVPILYIWLIALAVMVSRTQFGGPLAVRVDGRVVAHHTVLQVLVGAATGSLLGLAAVDWHSGRSCLLWLGLACVTLSLVATVAACGETRTAANAEKSESSDSEWSTEECLSSDRLTEDTSSMSDPDSRARWRHDANST